MKEYRPPAPAVPSRPAPQKPEKQAPPAPAVVADAPAFTPNPQSGGFQDPEGISKPKLVAEALIDFKWTPSDMLSILQS